ncbi:DNA polymerase III subunit beta [Longispora sp. NPDC051575]|uniref:DNA polymerase III subunit beta n=1 Tax=Longispora sp. NPDC051575 TaxID=3154943 RepID=UPI00343E6C10
MKLTIERADLLDAVAWAAGGLAARPVLPVLAGLVLRAGDGLTVSAFDYEVSTAATAPATVAEPGELLVSGRLLAQIVKSLPAGPLVLTAEGAGLVVGCAVATFTLAALPIEDYPAPPVPPPVAGTVDPVPFAEAVTQVVLAASRDDTVPAFTGARLRLDGETLTLSCIDRYRMAVRHLPWAPARPGLEATALVPARTLAAVVRQLTPGTPLTLRLATDGGRSGAAGDGLLGLESGARHTVTRLLDNPLADYVAQFPATGAIHATVATGALLDAVKRVALVAAPQTPVHLALSPGLLRLEARTGSEARATASVPAEYHGEGLSIGFNPRFLLDGLAALSGETVRMTFSGPGKPATLTDGTDFRYLLAAVRLPAGDTAAG